MTFSLHVDGERWRQHLHKCEMTYATHSTTAKLAPDSATSSPSRRGTDTASGSRTSPLNRPGLDSTDWPWGRLTKQPWRRRTSPADPRHAAVDPRDVIAKEVWDFIETRDFAPESQAHRCQR